LRRGRSRRLVVFSAAACALASCVLDVVDTPAVPAALVLELTARDSLGLKLDVGGRLDPGSAGGVQRELVAGGRLGMGSLVVDPIPGTIMGYWAELQGEEADLALAALEAAEVQLPSVSGLDRPSLRPFSPRVAAAGRSAEWFADAGFVLQIQGGRDAESWSVDLRETVGATNRTWGRITGRGAVPAHLPIDSVHSPCGRTGVSIEVQADFRETATNAAGSYTAGITAKSAAIVVPEIRC
jgi:hypothetical protein